jgi:2-phosphosulfolactate phosphatase
MLAEDFVKNGAVEARINMFFSQQEFDVRCEWGEHGVAQLVPCSDAVVIVDVLSFSTCVDIAVSRNAAVYPYRWKDESAIEYARSINAVLANFNRRFDTGYSLSPTSLLNIPKGTRLVLPSPNGSTLTLATGRVQTFAGCLRNSLAVASTLRKIGKRVSLIAAGEKWEDGSLRPAIEDLIGVGAIIQHLPGSRSPEAELAVAAFMNFRGDISSCLKRCGSGKELIQRDFESDIDLAAALDVSDCVPVLREGAYVRHSDISLP